ncbi:Vacuolar iron transporter-like protein 4 [Heracleum sosnowskyi]|uniref:Vacuolar iron transporter n=1 Tax=Heracleum sosnowskyi TaxID=360622 RepID=A0AAD8IIJ3_9APIA|nr:Vacuolar iron transporter-like protein 4 [Heracleum sosnowskyi]
MPSPQHKLSVVNETAESLKRLQRGQWIRAAVLGANDGLLSTTSLMLGVGAAKEDQWSMVLSGLAGAIAGACSMAVGEFVSVSTQRDIERSVIEKCEPEEKHSGDVRIQVNPIANPSAEASKSNVFTVSPSMDHPSKSPTPHPNYSQFLSSAQSPMMKIVMSDARISTLEGPEETFDDRNERLPNPFKAATASAVSFLCGSFFPLLAALLVHDNAIRPIVIVIVASLALVLFGVIGAFLGGSSLRLSAIRVLVGGWIAMGITYGLLKPLDKDGKGGKDKR